MRILLTVLAVVTTLGFAGLTAGSERRGGPEVYRPYLENYRRPPAVEFPDENRFTRERELLGRTLFFDPRQCSVDSRGDGNPFSIAPRSGVS